MASAVSYSAPSSDTDSLATKGEEVSGAVIARTRESVRPVFSDSDASFLVYKPSKQPPKAVVGLERFELPSILEGAKEKDPQMCKSRSVSGLNSMSFCADVRQGATLFLERVEEGVEEGALEF